MHARRLDFQQFGFVVQQVIIGSDGNIARHLFPHLFENCIGLDGEVVIECDDRGQFGIVRKERRDLFFPLRIVVFEFRENLFLIDDESVIAQSVAMSRDTFLYGGYVAGFQGDQPDIGVAVFDEITGQIVGCLLYTSPSPRD